MDIRLRSFIMYTQTKDRERFFLLLFNVYYFLFFLFLFHGTFLSNCSLLLDQNFLFTSKEESSQLKAIDFGLSDFVKPGLPLFIVYALSERFIYFLK